MDDDRIKQVHPEQLDDPARRDWVTRCSVYMAQRLDELAPELDATDTEGIAEVLFVEQSQTQPEVAAGAFLVQHNAGVLATPEGWAARCALYLFAQADSSLAEVVDVDAVATQLVEDLRFNKLDPRKAAELWLAERSV